MQTITNFERAYAKMATVVHDDGDGDDDVDDDDDDDEDEVRKLQISLSENG